MSNRPRGRIRLGLGISLLAVPLLGLVPPSHAAPQEVRGDGWNVTQTAGGYLVTVDLDKPLEMRSDAPTVVVDGEPVGLAVESADQRSLTAFTTDPRVVEADEVEAGWASEAVEGRARVASTFIDAPADEVTEELGIDPDAPGDFEWTESIYKFGDQAVDLLNIGGIRGEMEGKVYLPTSGGARPTVILLHGRHTSCYGTGPTHNNRWPCATAPDNELRMSIPSYAGYDNLAEALASHGYAVVSVSANAINSNDNQLAPDRGAMARGQLLLDTLEMLRKANAGQRVSYHDEWTDRELTLDEALVEGARSYELRREGFVDGAPDLDDVTAADFVGRFDLSNIGMMGHSRGGEGITAAATLNQGLEQPWAIKSILPLAPVDFGRMTVPDVPMNVVLPYCDGDVSNQQGQHMLDDSRFAYGDDVLRSATWMMGTNHNFHNTVWTPGKYKYSTSDDWSNSTARRTDPVCGTDASVADTSIRLSADEQYDLGSDYMTAWFRLTLGGEDEFLPMFDGTGSVPESADGADVRTVATAPGSSRAVVNTLEKASSQVRVTGSATAAPCASLSGRTTIQELAACSTSLASSQVPHWTPATLGGNVPATPLTRMTWTNATGQLRVSVPRDARDASAYDRLAVKMAADETVAQSTDLDIVVVDGSGNTHSVAVSELNPAALTRMPISNSSAGATTLGKIVLQQVNLPVADLAEAGIDVSDIREIRFTGVGQGAAYLSDVIFENSSVGTARVAKQTVIGLHAPKVDEGDAPDTYELAAFLDQPSDVPVTGYVSVLGAVDGRAGIAMEKVTFAPGETCKVVSAPLQGDTLPSSTASTLLTTSVINVSGAVQGAEAIIYTDIREDDGVTGNAVELPAFGTPGDPCAELAARGQRGQVTVAAGSVPGTEVPVSVAGMRAGESITFSAEGVEDVTVLADGQGVATAALELPGTIARGNLTVTATAAGTGRTSVGTTAVRDTSATTLSLSPSVPALREALALTATVTGGATAGTVEFFDGSTSLGTAPVTNGAATLSLPGFGAGSHALRAVYAGSGVTTGSESQVLSFTLARKAPSVLAQLSSASSIVGSGAQLVVETSERSGTVRFTVDQVATEVAVDADGRAVLDLPADLAVGEHTLTAQFLGNEDAAASTVATLVHTVNAAPTTTSVATKAAVRKGKKLTVKVTVASTATSLVPQGTVTVNFSGAKKVTRTATLAADGTATVKVKAPKKKGKVIKVRASYAGADAFTTSASTTTAVALR